MRAYLEFDKAGNSGVQPLAVFRQRTFQTLPMGTRLPRCNLARVRCAIDLSPPANQRMPPSANKSAAVVSIRVPKPRPSAKVLTPSAPRRSGTAIYGLTIFLSAFLLFQVELILGKFVLPRFGGGASVWSTSLLTFQLLLFAGYAYAAILTRRFTPKTQFRIHVSLLALS